MNILVVHEAHYASKIVYEFQIVPELLGKQGHDVTLIDFNEEAKGGWRSTYREEFYTRAHYWALRVITPGMLLLPGLRRLSYWFSCAWRIRMVLRRQKIDGIILYGMPTVGLQTWALAKWFKVPLLYRCIDATAELASKRPILRWLCDKIERFLYPKMRISCTTPALEKYVRERGARGVVRVLPSGVDCGMFRPGPAKLPPITPDSPKPKIILFAGTLYTFSGLRTVIRDFGKVRASHPMTGLVIAGDGDDFEHLKRMVRSLQLDDCIQFKGRVSYTDLVELIRCADICINPFELNPITEPIFPTKLLQYMACGKPVVMTPLPGTKAYFSGEAHGVVYCELPVMAASIALMLSLPEYLKELGDNAHKTAQRYDWNAIAAEIARDACQPS